MPVHTNMKSFNFVSLWWFFFRIPVRPDSLKNKSRTSNSDSICSSSEFLASDEPYYDMVATEDDYSLVKSNHSSIENVFSSSSTLPLDSKRDSAQNVNEPQSPGTSNYVNIEYFIQWVEKKIETLYFLIMFV